MNDLLEHQKREAGSGVSKVNVNMTSRIIATTNPIREIHAVEDLVNILDESFLSRWLVYYQTDEHVKMIRRSKDTELQRYDFTLSSDDWVSLLDYLHEFSAEYDMNKVEEVYLSVPPVLSETLKGHYDARHLHHIECLMDGIVKTRCLLGGDMSFKANEEDYKTLRTVWLAVIRSWVKPENIRKMPISERIFYLPENCQYLYWRLNELKRPVSRIETQEIAEKVMTKEEYIDAMNILKDMEILIVEDNMIRPYYMGEIKNEGKVWLSNRAEDEEMV